MVFQKRSCSIATRVQCQIAAALQMARQRVLSEVHTAHATKHAALASLDRDARAHQTHLTAVATRATEAQRQPNLQVFTMSCEHVIFFRMFLTILTYICNRN